MKSMADVFAGYESAIQGGFELFVTEEQSDVEAAFEKLRGAFPKATFAIDGRRVRVQNNGRHSALDLFAQQSQAGKQNASSSFAIRRAGERRVLLTQL